MKGGGILPGGAGGENAARIPVAVGPWDLPLLEETDCARVYSAAGVVLGLPAPGHDQPHQYRGAPHSAGLTRLVDPGRLAVVQLAQGGGNGNGPGRWPACWYSDGIHVAPPLPSGLSALLQRTVPRGPDGILVDSDYDWAGYQTAGPALARIGRTEISWSLRRHQCRHFPGFSRSAAHQAHPARSLPKAGPP